MCLFWGCDDADTNTYEADKLRLCKRPLHIKRAATMFLRLYLKRGRDDKDKGEKNFITAIRKFNAYYSPLNQ